MTDIKFTDNITVTPGRTLASDADVIAAARVSVLGDESVDELARDAEESRGLIRFLMRNRHGSPFEHTRFTFCVTAPIFVWREHMRHRIGWSYNEESGRYRQIDPVFYVPGPDRALVQAGKPGAYTYVPGTVQQHTEVGIALRHNSFECYGVYEQMLSKGVAREVARMVLPVNTMSTAWTTCNARSLMAFLSLRTIREGSTFPSYPMREIEMVAEQYEAAFAAAMPITYAAFCEAGRVSP